jgi:hypothetical protein
MVWCDGFSERQVEAMVQHLKDTGRDGWSGTTEVAATSFQRRPGRRPLVSNGC